MSLDNVTGTNLTMNFTWNVSKTRLGLEPVANSQTLQHRVSFTKGVGADAINELVAFIQTVTAGTTVNLDMSAALTNVVNDLLVPLARVKFFFAKLLSAGDTDQSGSVIGNGCSGVKLGGNANAWPFLVDKTDKVPLNNGDFVALTRRDATGMVVTPSTGDILDIQNLDGAVDAKVLLVFGGAAT